MKCDEIFAALAMLEKERGIPQSFMMEKIVQAFNAGVIPRCHLEDVTRADFYGFVVPFVNALQELSEEVSASQVSLRAAQSPKEHRRSAPRARM